MTKMADETFASTGLTSSYAFLMMTVNFKPGLSPKEISEHMLLSPSTVTRLIEKMEYKGLLIRESKGKFTEVYPTKKGVDIHEPIKKAWRELYQNYSQLLGEDEGKQLTQLAYEAVDQLRAPNKTRIL